MTTLTTVLGMLPLAVAIVAGLAFSTLVSLVLVPCVYLLLARCRSAAVGITAQPL
jgi:multidrug efflux pump subunit AcrB